MRYKILIVDDAYINRELLKEILRDDYDVLEAENGKEALEVIERKKKEISMQCFLTLLCRSWMDLKY